MNRAERRQQLLVCLHAGAAVLPFFCRVRGEGSMVSPSAVTRLLRQIGARPC